jgi:hypothetical protein
LIESGRQLNAKDLISGRHKTNYIQINKPFLYGCRLVIKSSEAFRVILFLLEKITGDSYNNIYEYDFSSFPELDRKINPTKHKINDSVVNTLRRGINELSTKKIICVVRNDMKFYTIRLNFFPDTWNVSNYKKEKIEKIIQRQIKSLMKP